MKTQFDHERLDVYQLELEFIAWVTPLLEEVRDKSTATTAEVRSQLDRASISMPLNTAEGNGNRQRRIRAKFFDDARGSAAECAACLDVLVAKGVCEPARLHEGKAMLFRIASMLTKLVELDDPVLRAHEEGAHYAVAPVDYEIESRA